MSHPTKQTTGQTTGQAINTVESTKIKTQSIKTFNVALLDGFLLFTVGFVLIIRFILYRDSKTYDGMRFLKIISKDSWTLFTFFASLITFVRGGIKIYTNIPLAE